MSELTGYGPGFPVGRAVETITKRELFAAMAMQGILSSWPENSRLLMDKTAEQAIAFADALIAALKGEP